MLQCIEDMSLDIRSRVALLHHAIGDFLAPMLHKGLLLEQIPAGVSFSSNPSQNGAASFSSVLPFRNNLCYDQSRLRSQLMESARPLDAQLQLAGQAHHIWPLWSCRRTWLGNFPRSMAHFLILASLLRMTALYITSLLKLRLVTDSEALDRSST